MHAIPKCSKCRFYAHDYHLVCVPHPNGPGGDTCLDFEPDPALESRHFVDFLGLHRQTNPEPGNNLWERETASYYNGQLILQPRHRWMDEQIHLLSTHPMLTGRCPACGAEFERDYRAVVHWDCPCGWIDDSI